MLRILWVGISTLLTLAIIASCGGSAAKLGAPEANESAGLGATVPVTGNLPGLPQAGWPARATAAAVPYQFGVGDVYDSELTSFDGNDLVLPRAGMAWAILGADGAGEMPTALDLAGTCDGLYLAISDYSRGCWHWLGGPYNGPAAIPLPSGEWCNGSGAFYVAVVCPDDAEGRITLAATLTAVADWNVLVWIAGDNNLAEDAVNDLNEMEAVGSTAHVRVLAGYDIMPDALAEPVAGTDAVHFIKVVSDADALAVNVTGDPANQSFPRAGYNSADPANVAAFVDWAEANFPAQHTMLVLWNHGSGWLPGDDGIAGNNLPGHGASAILADDSDGDWDSTGNTYIATALAAHHFDIFGCDACNMAQIEALYDFRGLADFYIASQALEPNAGWNYTYLLTEWNANFPLDLSAIGNATVTGFKAYYDANPEEATLTAVGATELTALVTALHDLAAEVTAKAATEADFVKQAISTTYEPVDGDGARDLGGFLDAYAGLTSDAAIQAKITTAQAAYAAAISSFDQVDLPDCTGLCAWLPSTTYFTDSNKLDYGNLAFDEATGWLAMLTATGVPDTNTHEWDVPLLTWEPGDRVVVEWGDATQQINPFVEDPDYNSGTPFEPEELDGVIEFSQDSTVSNAALEYAELLPGATPGMYTIALTAEDVASEVATVKLVDELGTLIQEFHTFTLTDTGSYYGDVAYLFYNDGSFTAADWEPGDYVKVDWGDALADFDLTISAPDGLLGYPEYPDDLAGSIEFSEDSYYTGVPWETGTLLETATHGAYAISVFYYDYDWLSDPPAEINATVELYDSSGTLKQTLGTLTFDGYGFESGENYYAAILNY
jgi:hypothetical protein